MSRVRPEALVVEEMRKWLLLKLPAQVATINAARYPTLIAPRAGPYTLPGAGKGLYISLDGRDGPFTHCVLTGGVRTANAVASDINSAGGVIPADLASVDADGRVALSKLAAGAPTATAQLIAVGSDQGEAVNEVFGWNPGGELLIREPLVAPLGTGVCDGWPVLLDCGPGFWVIIGKRVGVPVQPGDVRRDSHQVGLEMTIMLKDTNIQNSRSREAIEACVQCVREVLLTDRGRYIGQDGQGTVMKVEEKACIIPGSPWRATDEQGNVLGIFDTATYSVSVRVYARPDAT